MAKDKSGFDTRAIHAGQKSDPVTGAVMTPIYASSTYKQESPGVHKGYEYSRTSNPTRKALEDCISRRLLMVITGMMIISVATTICVSCCLFVNILPMWRWWWRSNF